MRTLSALLFLASLFFLTSSMRARTGVEIISVNGYEICSGHGEENFALVEIVSLPSFGNLSSIRLEYLWTMEHEMGNRVWQTNFSQRRVPIPWTGSYTVKAMVLYFHRNSSRPFAAFPSNTIRIVGLDCEGQRWRE